MKREMNATAMPADMPADMPVTPTADQPDIVLPYDPADWDRRLAEARTRRAAVLAAGASTLIDTAPPVALPGRTGGTRPALVPSARAENADDGVPRAAPTRPDADAWRRRLAEARGLTPATGHATAPPTPSQAKRMTEDVPRGPARTTVLADTPPDAAPLAAAVQGGSVLRVATLAGLTGVAAGAVLAALLVGQWPAAAPAPVPAAAQATLTAPAGVPPVTVRTGAFLPPTARDPSVPSPSVSALTSTADMPARHAAPAMTAGPAMPETAPVALMSPPPAPPVATGDDAPPFVVVHVPPVPAAVGTSDLMAEGVAQGWAVVPVGFTVSQSHLRVYHAVDMPAATTLGDRLGLPIRDFIGAIPAPEGLIEVWVAGGPASGG